MVALARPFPHDARLKISDVWPLTLVRIPVVTDAAGNYVELATGQFRKIIIACIVPAVMVASAAVTYAWREDTRMTKIETIGEMLVDTVREQQKAIEGLRSNSASLERIDQRLIDQERRMATIEAQLNTMQRKAP